MARLVEKNPSYIAHLEKYEVVPSLAFAFKLEHRLGLKTPLISREIIELAKKKALNGHYRKNWGGGN